MIIIITIITVVDGAGWRLMGRWIFPGSFAGGMLGGLTAGALTGAAGGGYYPAPYPVTYPAPYPAPYPTPYPVSANAISDKRKKEAILFFV